MNPKHLVLIWDIRAIYEKYAFYLKKKFFLNVDQRKKKLGKLKNYMKKKRKKLCPIIKNKFMPPPKKLGRNFSSSKIKIDISRIIKWFLFKIYEYFREDNNHKI